MTHNHTLDCSLDTAAAVPLAAALSGMIAQSTAVCIDAAGVERTGQACLQVLMSAQISAAKAGIGFVIDRPSDDLAASVRLLGLDALLASAA